MTSHSCSNVYLIDTEYIPLSVYYGYCAKNNTMGHTNKALSLMEHGIDWKNLQDPGRLWFAVTDPKAIVSLNKPFDLRI